MQRVYLFFVKWDSTKGNHAGMAYLCRKLDELNPNIKAIRVPEPICFRSRIKTIGIRKLNKYFDKYLLIPFSNFLNSCIQLFYYRYFKTKLKDNGILFFMEYITTRCKYLQEDLAAKLRKSGQKINMFGLMHLPQKYLFENDIYSTDEAIRLCLSYLDKILVFGSSLKKYIANLGLGDKVIQTFHYVDTDYYYPVKRDNVKQNLRVICIGFIMRDYNKLCKIIERLPSVDFDICMGRFDLTSNFKFFRNVKLHGLLSEIELRCLMQKAHVSLNVLEDTVGSNVITTSLATGLVIVVSDVGSIRDCCDQSNAFFCRDIQDYVNSIKSLVDDPSLLISMSQSARKKALSFSLDQFNKEINSLFL